jgi:calcineurin-like phosphoesterase family protein
MLCYFDSDNEVNLSRIEQIKNVRSLKELKTRLSVSNFQFITSTEYAHPGIYIVEVSKIPKLWCAKTFPSSDNVLLNIPSRVIFAAKKQLIRIVILSIIEGDNFTSDDFDGFKHLNGTMKLLGLPKHSVLIVSGNLNAAQQYTDWCYQNNEQELIEFSEGIEWDGKESNQIDRPVSINDYRHVFSSLNRAHRAHRTEHLYLLAQRNLLGSSLVSGGAWFDDYPIQHPKYCEIDYENYKNVLLQHYPRTVDVAPTEIKTTVPNLTNNIEIYENTLLSVVTESHFDQDGGLFITEKTFRPILVGHPFMILGQPNILKKLQELGFKTDFEGIDTEYDNILDNKSRFILFHNSLYNWAVLDREVKRTMLYRWKNTIFHNFHHYKKCNFKKVMFDGVISSSELYFTKGS